MIKEEKELRKWVRHLVDNDRASKLSDEKEMIPDRKRLLKLITALVRAVREDCAKVGSEAIKKCMRSPKIEVQEKVVNVIADYVAAALRGRG